MHLQYHHVDGARHPCHQRLMDRSLVRRMVNGMENPLGLRLDEALLSRALRLDVRGELRIPVLLLPGDCQTLVAAHPDELVG